jgi:hypothetical protein
VVEAALGLLEPLGPYRIAIWKENTAGQNSLSLNSKKNVKRSSAKRQQASMIKRFNLKKIFLD